jgi:hypothetical protein
MKITVLELVTSIPKKDVTAYWQSGNEIRQSQRCKKNKSHYGNSRLIEPRDGKARRYTQTPSHSKQPACAGI